LIFIIYYQIIKLIKKFSVSAKMSFLGLQFSMRLKNWQYGARLPMAQWRASFGVSFEAKFGAGSCLDSGQNRAPA
jgi:hypothetical protein